MEKAEEESRTESSLSTKVPNRGDGMYLWESISYAWILLETVMTGEASLYCFWWWIIRIDYFAYTFPVTASPVCLSQNSPKQN